MSMIADSKPEDARLIDANNQDDDRDTALRPKRFDDFIGQRHAKDNLLVFVEAAKLRSEALDHVLFHGPPGLGKTTLAQIVANELSVNFRSTSGPVITKPGDLAALLTNLEQGDVLFIDEIHRLSAAVEEVLYPAMEDFSLDLMIGEGPAARSVKIDLPRFTLIGATTRAGLLAKPLRDRFGIPVRLNFYDADELQQIVLRGASKLGAYMAADGAMEIARRARGTPRVAGRLLRRVRDVAQVEGADKIDQKIADRALRRLEIDAYGLDPLDRRYLRLIGEQFGGGPVGIETIAAALSEARDGVEDVIEPYLLQQGFIQRTPRGRLLGADTWKHLGLAPPNISRTTRLIRTCLMRKLPMTNVAVPSQGGARFQAVIFDCDGVLVDSEALGLNDMVAYLKAEGFQWEAPDLIRLFTGFRDDVFRQKLEAAYVDLHGVKPSESLFEGLVRTRRKLKDQLQPVAGAQTTIVSTRDMTLDIAVASSSRAQYLESKLRRTGLWDDLSPHVYSAEFVMHGKPAPDIFLYAAEQLKVDPQYCLVLEDSVQGVKAGLAAGMEVWGFLGGGHCFEGHDQRLIDAGSHQIITDFSSFLSVLERRMSCG